MEVKLTWQEGVYFHGQAREHTIPIEGPETSGGKNRGARPMETILVGLASCSAYDVLSILAKSRQPVAGCEVDVTAKRSDAIPSVFTEILLHFRFTSIAGQQGLDNDALLRAIGLSVDKYCSVAKMLRDGGVVIKYSHIIEEL